MQWRLFSYSLYYPLLNGSKLLQLLAFYPNTLDGIECKKLITSVLWFESNPHLQQAHYVYNDPDIGFREVLDIL